MAGKLEVDTEGFRKRVAWRGPFGVLSELISNALDENVTTCEVVFEHVDGQRYRITVADDSPDGFRNLRESYTLYAESYKAGNTTQRGRFNFGEKVAIVLCDEALIESTTGAVEFRKDEVRHLRRKRDRGTVFTGIMRCTKLQYEDALARIKTVIAPPGINFTINGAHVLTPKHVTTVTGTLPTITINDAGELIKPPRQTTIDVYEKPGDGEGMIYELGIPVVAVDHPFIMDVRQKVPLSVDRNNVTPGYYRKLCAAVLDGTADRLTEEQARSKGVSEGIALAKKDEMVTTVMELRHGKDRFVPDPRNQEGNGELFARKFKPVYGGSYDGKTWDRINEAGAIKSVNEFIPKRSVPPVAYQGEVTRGMRLVADLAKLICAEVLGKELQVSFSGNGNVTCSAQCGPSIDGSVHLVFHVPILGEQWFTEKPILSRENLDLIFHELGHHEGAQDCTREHCDQTTRVAATVSVLVQTQPELFEKFK